jgi:hypothetical protein
MIIRLISFHIQTLGIGFVTLNSMLLTMLTRYWLVTRLTWMKAKGFVLLLLSLYLSHFVCVCVRVYILVSLAISDVDLTRTLFSGCSYLKGPSSCRRIWHQVLWDCEEILLLMLICRNCWFCLSFLLSFYAEKPVNYRVQRQI